MDQLDKSTDDASDVSLSALLEPRAGASIFATAAGDAALDAACGLARAVLDATDGDALCDELTTHGWAFVRLPEAARVATAALVDVLPAAFELMGAAPRGPYNTGKRYYGYAAVAGVKQMMFVRLDADGHAHPLDGVELLREVSAAAFVALESVATAVYFSVMESLQLSTELAAQFVEPPRASVVRGDDASRWRTASELVTFRYASQSTVEPCALHVDYTLVTLIPVAAQPGLAMLDTATFELVEPERLAREMGYAPGELAVVFGGESLSLVTNGLVAPGNHAVSATFDRPRFSTPFLLYGAPDAVVDVRAYHRASLGLLNRHARPVTIGEHVADLRAQCPSVNYR